MPRRPSNAPPADRRHRREPPAVWIALVVVLAGLGSWATFAGPAPAGVADVVAIGCPLGAGIACLRAARRAARATRRGWTTIAVSCWCWTGAELAWTYYDHVLGEAPFPSPADAGYLGYSVAMVIGLLWLAPPASGLSMSRRVLDGLLVGTALCVLAWVFVLRAVIAGSAGSPLSDALSLFYPLVDIVLMTIVVLAAAQSHHDLRRWGFLGAAMLSISLADYIFAYQVAAGSYQDSTMLEWGWWLGAGLITVAALTSDPTEGESGRGALPATPRAGLLPYLPLAAAITAVTVDDLIFDGRHDIVTEVLLLVMVASVLLRQYLTVRENNRLTRVVQHREAQLHHLAFHDALTGLPNRALFLNRLEHALELARRDLRPVSVAFLDLDGFKAVNDTLGHAVGDALLVRVAERMRGALRTSDTLARLGGDEFAILLEQGDDPVATAAGLLGALRLPFQLDERTVAVSASVGVATAEPGGADAGSAAAADLLHRADIAMYAVKTSGKAHVQAHSTALDISRQRNEPALHREFATAITDGGIGALFQPVVDPVSGQIRGLQIVPGWTHHGAEVPPEVFVPICEATGLSAQLTATVLEQACRRLDTWNRQLGHRELWVAVVIDPTELSDTGLPDRLATLLARHELGRGQLVLQITEHATGNRQEVALEVMHRLRALGVRLALDDFGVAYSTFARLTRSPVDTVTIDRTFVADIDHDAHQRQCLAGLLQLAHHLGLDVVVAGCERPGQLQELRRLGCGLVTGRLVGTAGTGDELSELLLADRSPLAPELLGLATSARG